jgi:hypothetical protein
MLMYSFISFNSRVNNIFKTLGIPEREAQDQIWKIVAGNEFSFSANTKFESLPAKKRAVAVYEMGHYVKKYLGSPEFDSQYQQLRSEKRPVAPATIQERINYHVAEFSNALRENEAAYKRIRPELQPLYEASIKNYNQSIMALENEHDPQHAKLVEGIIIQHDYDMSEFAHRTRQFEKEYPGNARAFIKLRLHEFLQLSSNVDFNAVLVERSGKKIFLSQSYEAKPSVWKYCFRAGEKSTVMARALAQQWLKEL